MHSYIYVNIYMNENTRVKKYDSSCCDCAIRSRPFKVGSSCKQNPDKGDQNDLRIQRVVVNWSTGSCA
jgi:hypothetical protein